MLKCDHGVYSPGGGPSPHCSLCIEILRLPKEPETPECWPEEDEEVAAICAIAETES
jgi:hypothetical protein